MNHRFVSTLFSWRLSLSQTTALRGFALGLAAVFAPVLSISASAETMYVAGESEVPLAVTVTGPEDGPQILFLHGIGMGTQTFAPQLKSDLADDFRMVAFDLRGHGLSGKPWQDGAYSTPEIWAEDVRRVIAATGLCKPIIVGWSYGSLVAADYLRIDGPDGMSGLVLVGSLASFVPLEQSEQNAEQIAAFRTSRTKPDFADLTGAVNRITPMLVAGHAADGWLETAREYGLMVPPYAQKGLRSRTIDNRDLLPSLNQLPLAVLYGQKDNSVDPADLPLLRRSAPAVQVHEFLGLGHSPFAEDPDKFNEILARFAETNWRNSNCSVLSE